MATEMHELKCKLVCLARLGEFALQELIRCYALQNSKKMDPDEAMADILDGINKDNKLEDMNSLKYKDNKEKIFVKGTSIVKNKVEINCLDVTVLGDLAQNVPTFPSSIEKHRLHLVCQGCNASNDKNNIVCCKGCKLCLNCNSNTCKTPKVREVVLLILGLRNDSAHITNGECFLFENAVASGNVPSINLGQKLISYSDGINNLMQLMVDMSMVTEATEKDVNFKVDCIVRLEKKIYWGIVNGTGDTESNEPMVYEEVLTITYEFSAGKCIINEVKDITSQTSRIISSSFALRATELLMKELNVATNEHKFRVSSQGMKFEPTNQAYTRYASINLQISSTNLKIPCCFKNMNSSESMTLQKDLVSAFTKIISNAVAAKIESICTGWIFSSINIYFMFIPSREEERSTTEIEKEVQLIYAVITDAIEKRNAEFIQVLRKHNLEKCATSISLHNTSIRDDTITLQARIIILDEMLKEQIKTALPILKEKLEKEIPGYQILKEVVSSQTHAREEIKHKEKGPKAKKHRTYASTSLCVEGADCTADKKYLDTFHAVALERYDSEEKTQEPRKYLDEFHADEFNDSEDETDEPSFISEKVKELIRAIASYQGMDDDGKKKVFDDILGLIQDNDYESFKHLELPSIVHMRDPDCNLTLLHIAAIYNRPHMMTLLLSHGADHTAGGVFGDTPYHICAKSDDRYDGLLLLLTSHDEAAVNLVNDYHQTALHRAAWCGAIANVRLLLQHGADVEVEDKRGRKPDHDELVCTGWRANKDNKEAIQTMIAEYRKKNVPRQDNTTDQ